MPPRAAAVFWTGARAESTHPKPGRFTNDIRQIRNTVSMSLRIMAKAPLTVFGGVIKVFAVNGKLAAVFLVTVPVLIGFLSWVLKSPGGVPEHAGPYRQTEPGHAGKPRREACTTRLLMMATKPGRNILLDNLYMDRFRYQRRHLWI